MAKRLFVVVVILGLTSIVALGQAKSDLKMLAGTWKLNVAKSKFSPGPAPKSQTLTWKPTATGFSFTNDRIDAQGQTTHNEQNGTFDGKPYAVKFANFSGMRTTKWVDAFKYESVDTIDGKVMASRTSVISKDGKMLTVTSKGTNAQGQPTGDISVYEKQ